MFDLKYTTNNGNVYFQDFSNKNEIEKEFCAFVASEAINEVKILDYENKETIFEKQCFKRFENGLICFNVIDGEFNYRIHFADPKNGNIIMYSVSKERLQNLGPLDLSKELHKQYVATVVYAMYFTPIF